MEIQLNPVPLFSQSMLKRRDSHWIYPSYYFFIIVLGVEVGGFYSSGRSSQHFVESWKMAEKVTRDIFREELVDDSCIKTSMAVSEGGLYRSVWKSYSGGSSGDNEGHFCGGGGESFNARNDPQNKCCYRTSGHVK